MGTGLVRYPWPACDRDALRELIGGSLISRRHAAADVLIAGCGWGVWMVFQLAWNRWIGPTRVASIHPLLVQHIFEIPVWVALWRKSLRPGMMAHALTDIIAGIF